MLIDVENSGNGNLITREVQKILKYKVLAVDIQQMWNVKRKSVPLITGATGTVSKSLRQIHKLKLGTNKSSHACYTSCSCNYQNSIWCSLQMSSAVSRDIIRNRL